MCEILQWTINMYVKNIAFTIQSHLIQWSRNKLGRSIHFAKRQASCKSPNCAISRCTISSRTIIRPQITSSQTVENSIILHVLEAHDSLADYNSNWLCLISQRMSQIQLKFTFLQNLYYSHSFCYCQVWERFHTQIARKTSDIK